MGSMKKKALADLHALEASGFDGVLIENDQDKPHTEFANPAQIACFTAIADAVIKEASIPVGIQMMLNDWKASFGIAGSVGAQFSRLDVFVDHVTSTWGEINPDPKEIMAWKQQVAPHLVLLTDIQVKYKTMIQPRPLHESARLAIQQGADGLVITGNATGEETPISSLQEIHEIFPETPIFVGAGIQESNIKKQFAFAHGAIIGTSIKTGDAIDKDKALRLRQLSGT